MPRGRRPPAKPPSCTPLDLPSLDLGFVKAALAADLITAALKFYGIRGGCASSRLIHGPLFAIFGRASAEYIKKSKTNAKNDNPDHRGLNTYILQMLFLDLHLSPWLQLQLVRTGLQKSVEFGRRDRRASHII